MGIYTYRYWDGKMGHPEHIIQYIMNYTYYISGGETGIPKSAVRVAARFKKIQREREREHHFLLLPLCARKRTPPP